MDQKKKKVFVAMSGGVDSSVAAALLKRDGYDVYGFFMQGWQNPNFTCTWKEDRRDAARVAALLHIPFRTLDFSHEYYERVVRYLIDEYKAGLTPNPDVACNKEIKFGLFFDWAMGEGADFVATGHYARRDRSQLMAARDTNKDQTYFLWALTPEVISRTLFPIGGYTKPEVRALAKDFGLPTAEKEDSQGICFVGKGSIADFLKGEICTTPGLVRVASGEVVGRHDGVELFTIGQRHGVGLRGGSAPLYVAQKDLASGTITVAHDTQDSMLYQKTVLYKNANWLAKNNFPFEAEARIRYRGALARCLVHEDRVLFENAVRAVAPGQSIVFYKNGAVLGGGVIS